jgi:hypothetical protein
MKSAVRSPLQNGGESPSLPLHVRLVAEIRE